MGLSFVELLGQIKAENMTSIRLKANNV